MLVKYVAVVGLSIGPAVFDGQWSSVWSQREGGSLYRVGSEVSVRLLETSRVLFVTQVGQIIYGVLVC